MPAGQRPWRATPVLSAWPTPTRTPVSARLRVGPAGPGPTGRAEGAVGTPGARGLAAGAGSDALVGRRRPDRAGAARCLADLLRTRPRPDFARHIVPPAGRQDPGLRLPPGSPAHPAHPRARGGAGRHGHRTGLPPERGPHRGHRPRARLRHGPGGHASEDASTPTCRGVRPRAMGASVSSLPSTLCRDGGRHRQPQLVAPGAVHAEGEVVSWADRIAYVCHDWRMPSCPASWPASAAAGGPLALRRAPQRPARRLYQRCCVRLAPQRPGRHGGGGGRGTRRLPDLQLRAHLPAGCLAPAGRRGDQRAAPWSNTSPTVHI